MKFYSAVFITLAIFGFMGLPVGNFNAVAADYLEEDFEAWPPLGWEHISTAAKPEITYSWYQGIVWTLSDNYYASVDWYDAQPSTLDEWLITPSIDLSAAMANLELQFYFRCCYAYQVSPVDDGDMFIRVSTDGGATWSNPIWTENDYGVFNDYEWTQDILDLSAYAGESNFKLAFGYEGPICWEVCFDSILLTDGTAPHDHEVAAVGIKTPISVGDAGSPVTPETTFGNMGGNTESFTANMTITLDAVEVYNEDVGVVDLAGNGTTIDVTFPEFTPTEKGVYQVTASTVLAGDQFASNDALEDDFNTIPKYCFFADFEDGDCGFTFTGDWEHGDPTTNPVHAWSGYNIFGTKLHDTYTGGFVLSELTSPEIDLGDEPVMTFQNSYSSEWRFDGGNVKITTDGGARWELITPEDGYDHQLDMQNPLGSEWAFTGVKADWRKETFDLTAYANQTVQFKFSFGSDGSWIYGSGWNIDDIHVIDVAPLSHDAQTLPLAGGIVSFEMDAGFKRGGSKYFLLASATGTQPGTPLPGGLATLPLEWDVVTELTILLANSAMLPNSAGIFDPTGDALASFDTLGALPPSALGTTLHFAYLTYKPYDFASNPVSVEIVP